MSDILLQLNDLNFTSHFTLPLLFITLTYSYILTRFLWH